MPEPVAKLESVTRDEAIARLRAALVELTDGENSICKIAAERGVFCNGFRRFDERELRERYWWIVRKRPEITREELETIANDWQLAQQDVRDLPLACDVQSKVHDTCRGWHDFSNPELEAYYRQVTGESVRIVS